MTMCSKQLNTMDNISPLKPQVVTTDIYPVSGFKLTKSLANVLTNMCVDSSDLVELFSNVETVEMYDLKLDYQAYAQLSARQRTILSPNLLQKVLAFGNRFCSEVSEISLVR